MTPCRGNQQVRSQTCGHWVATASSAELALYFGRFPEADLEKMRDAAAEALRGSDDQDDDGGNSGPHGAPAVPTTVVPKSSQAPMKALPSSSQAVGSQHSQEHLGSPVREGRATSLASAGHGACAGQAASSSLSQSRARLRLLRLVRHLSQRQQDPAGSWSWDRWSHLQEGYKDAAGRADRSPCSSPDDYLGAGDSQQQLVAAPLPPMMAAGSGEEAIALMMAPAPYSTAVLLGDSPTPHDTFAGYNGAQAAGSSEAAKFDDEPARTTSSQFASLGILEDCGCLDWVTVQ